MTFTVAITVASTQLGGNPPGATALLRPIIPATRTRPPLRLLRLLAGPDPMRPPEPRRRRRTSTQ